MVSDSPGLQHPLGIEAVHWSAGTGADLVVRVAGRWRRRRPASTAVPVLAIDTEHQRYRFPALPEPPSVRGAQPGLWQVRFTVPASLAPYLAGRLTLMLGSVSISLPPAVADPGEPIPARPADRGNRHAELAEAETSRWGAGTETANGEARTLSDWLELELMQSRSETERLRTELGLAERKRREAEQLAHSEAAMRIDLGRDHAARMRRHQADALAVLELLQAVQIHSRTLAHEIETLRRSADEASRVQPRGPRSDSRACALATEMAIAKSTPPAPAPEVARVSSETPGLALELMMRVGERSAAESRVTGALIRLAAEQAAAEELFTRGPAVQGQPARDRARAAYVMDAIDGIGRQLAAARAAVALLPPPAPDAGDRAMPSAHRRGPDAREQPAGGGAFAPARGIGRAFCGVDRCR